MGWRDLFRRGDAQRAVPQPADTGESYGLLSSLYNLGNAERVSGGFAQFAASAYGGNAVVFAVENRRLTTLSEATFKYRLLSDKHLFGDTSLGKLERPWPGGTTGDLLSRMELHAALGGSAYVRDAGDQLEMLRPDWVTIVSRITLDAYGEEIRQVIGYAFDPVGDPDRSPAFYPVDEVAQYSPYPDPCATFRGMSWLTPVIREINADFKMAGFRDAYFDNAATANLIVKYQQKVGPERIKALREMIATKHTGIGNAFGTLVFDEGGDPMVVGADMEGAAFDALQAAGETRIAAAGGVPAVIAGLRQGMQATAPGEYQAASRSFVDMTMRPLWRSACAALARLVAVPPGAQLWYDTTDVSALQQGERDKADTLQQMAATANTLIMAGYTPDTVTSALSSGDFSLLKHSGLVSVQMQQLQAPATPPVPALNGRKPTSVLAGAGG